LCFIIIVCFLSFSVSANYSLSQNLNLFGIATYQELKNDIYMGAIFSNATNIQALFRPSTSKKMSLRFLRSYSNRKIIRFWKQGIAMNNNKMAWKEYTPLILSFTHLFKRSMQKGDEIALIYTPSIGTQIYFNQTLFLTIKEADFFPLLLNVWLGNIPPTQSFKLDISGIHLKKHKKNLTHFYRLIPEIGRFDADKPVPHSLTLHLTNEKPKKPFIHNTIKPTSEKNKKKLNTSVNQLVEGFKYKIENAHKKNHSKKPRSKKIASLKPKHFSLPKKTLPIQLNTSISVPNISSFKPNIKKTPILHSVESDYDFLFGAFTREVLSFIEKNKKYPRKALIKGHQGDLMIHLKINSDGNILNSSLKKRSGSRLLDKGALRQLRAMAPFPSIPKKLKMSIFTFDIPMSFFITE
jgi:TonB family protein